MKNRFLSKLFGAAAVLCCVLMLVSCEDDWEAPYMKVTGTEYNISGAASQISIPIETNSGWRIVSSVPSWITIGSMDGSGTSELVVDVAENTSFARSCDLLIAANTNVETVKITQSASTSGRLSVTTGDCTVTGLLGKYTLTIGFTVANPHLASSAGVEIDGKKYRCEGKLSSSYNYVQVTLTALSVNGLEYRAYAVNKSTGQYVYGSTKTISK